MDPKAKEVGRTHTTGPRKGRTQGAEKHLGMRPAPEKGEFHKAGRGPGTRGCWDSHRPGTSCERWPDRRPFGAGGVLLSTSRGMLRHPERTGREIKGNMATALL